MHPPVSLQLDTHIAYTPASSTYGAADSPGELWGVAGPPHAHDHLLWKRPRRHTPRRARAGGLNRSKFLVVLSLVCNLALLVVKVYIVVRSGSLVVVASAVDSVLDLVAQLIILAALRAGGDNDLETWPLGRSRLEPVGIIVVASLMGFAALQVVSESVLRLWTGMHEGGKPPTMDLVSVVTLLGVIAVKVVLYLLCVRSNSSSVATLAEDHMNDVLSNIVVLATAWTAHAFRSGWFLDPVGAIGISVFIMTRWLDVGREQAAMLVGRSAHPEFLHRVADLAAKHDAQMKVDWVRAYHFGKRYLVEIEAVMAKDTTLLVAHDVSLALQKKIELLSEVERAHVHVDYEFRDENEHKSTHPDDDNDDDDRGGGDDEEEQGL